MGGQNFGSSSILDGINDVATKSVSMDRYLFHCSCGNICCITNALGTRSGICKCLLYGRITGEQSQGYLCWNYINGGFAFGRWHNSLKELFC